MKITLTAMISAILRAAPGLVDELQWANTLVGEPITKAEGRG